MNIMHLVFCLDNNYIMPYGVTMTSICENNLNYDIMFHVITDNDFTIKNEKSLFKIANKYHHSLKIYKVDITSMLNYPPFCNSIATYYRLLLADILPVGIDKVLYLDGDLIVRTDLQELWVTDISEYSVGAIIENRETNNNQSNKYFSAGVMLINLQYWRSNNVGACTQNFINKFPEKCIIVDQDALNAVLNGTIKWLPIKYNIMCYAYHREPFIRINRMQWIEIQRDRLNPAILHYNAPRKPWNYGSTMMYQEEFFKYLALTEWREFKVEFELSIFFRNILRSLAQSLNLFPKLIDFTNLPEHLQGR